MYILCALPLGPADRLQKLMRLLPSRSVKAKLPALTLICVSWFAALAWQTPGPVGLRIIVVSSPTEAQQILDRLAKGEDFAALAKAKSTDPTADGGGFMGKLDPASLRPELRDALQGLSPGQLTGVIKIPAGYAILQIVPEEQSTAGIGMSSSQMLPLTGRGSVRYTPDISGAVDMELAFRKVPKPDDWNRDFQAVCETRKRALATVGTPAWYRAADANAVRRASAVVIGSRVAARAGPDPAVVAGPDRRARRRLLRRWAARRAARAPVTAGHRSRL